MSGRLFTSPAVSRLVEKQMSNWELARRQRVLSPAARSQEVADFVTLSRMVGIEAVPIASEVGRRLGWPVFDREILDHMAGDDQIRRQIYAAMDERDLSWWEDSIGPLIHGEFRRNDYFHRLCDTVLALARQGSAVFLGRGADLLLPRSRGCRVRLVASLAHRVHAMAERSGVTEDEATKEITRIEEERADYLQRHFRLDPDDPARYDLSINVDHCPAQDVVEMILAAHAIRARAQSAGRV